MKILGLIPFFLVYGYLFSVIWKTRKESHFAPDDGIAWARILFWTFTIVICVSGLVYATN